MNRTGKLYSLQMNGVIILEDTVVEQVRNLSTGSRYNK